MKTQNNLLQEIYEEYNKCANSIMKDLKIEQNENVKNLLKYFYITNLMCEYKYGNRIYYDLDAKYIFENSKFEGKKRKDNALCADMMVSFWKLYYLTLKQNGVKVKFKGNTLFMQQLINSKNNDVLKVNKIFDDFASSYATRGNILLLPERKLNNLKWKYTGDRIEVFIYYCFNNEYELLDQFFDGSVKKLEQWIEQEKLTALFLNQKEIKGNAIKDFRYKEDKCLSKESCMKFEMFDETEIKNYLANLCKLISDRNWKFENM